MTRAERFFHRSRTALAAFLSTETAGGTFLLVATVAALVWANVSGTYDAFWPDLRHWVNDWLMTVFFFVVGLEIKRELVVGELRERRVASLPLVAAAGGMIAPALIYLALNAGTPTVRGWAIPMATDIAFVIGALSLLGPRIPHGLRVFLLALAIADDIGAIVVIALFYAGGIHPTLVAVAAAFLVPRRFIEGAERLLHPVSSYVVVPVFALANAGITLRADSFGASRVFWGVAVGLVVGKAAGIFGAVRLAVASNVGRLPAGVTARHIAGGAALSGIGFTVSLFITGLAFDSAQLIDEAKLGVLVGSIVSASIGATILRRS
jgi:NhaA family Na+:H+ antiporter